VSDAPTPAAKVTVPALGEAKRAGRPIVALTAYDYPTGRIVDAANVGVTAILPLDIFVGNGDR